ncbi:MAG: ubiquinol-cytochrome c reductase iron-sulfur subunit [Gammaproteobacteria bacterium]|nr:ubiquinol-cytochrome c reductase iron-sulfur subunit [Gammaproteobacteria bacterium]
MSEENINKERRNFLAIATATASGMCAAAASVPFLKSWNPSAATVAMGAPVLVDIGNLQVGEQKIVEWRRKPVWIIRRTQEEIERLLTANEFLRDPNSDKSDQPSYVKNSYRSIRPEILVLIGICTHLGCSPKYRPELGSVNATWQGGFFCPCHGSIFDMAGRVLKGVPAPTNLQVPPYAFLNDTTLLIGMTSEDDLSEWKT